MDSFELNKIFGAILGTLVFVMGVGLLAEAIYAPIDDRGATYELPMPEGTGEEAAEAAPEVASIAERLQTASADSGANLINRCQSCHDYSSANENRTGPGLWNVVGRPIAGHQGFAYSDALASLGEAGDTWTYESLDAFLESPRNFAPGTKMTFAGLSNPEDRANLIAFLREQADSPEPLPEAPAQEAETESQDEAELADEGAAPAETVEVPAEGGAEAAPVEAEAAPATGEAPAAEEEAAPAEEEAATGDQASTEAAFAALVDSVDPAAGERVAARCLGCHDLSQANANRVGPGLYDVFERQIGDHPGYGYSDALAGLGAEGQQWTIANLDAFIANPSGFAPGTKMAFAGIQNETERAELIAYLRSLGN